MQDKEIRGITAGRIKKHNQKDETKINHYMFYVWYREQYTGGNKNKKDPRILFQTASSKKETAENLRSKLLKSGLLKDCESGVVRVLTNMEDFIYIKDLSTKDRHFLESLKTEKYIVVDTETTGFAKWDQVIDLAAVRVENNKIVDSFQRYIVPTCKVSSRAIKVHGLSKEFLQDNGIEARKAFKEFSSFIKGGGAFVGHNISFDKRMIEKHSAAVGIPIDIDIAFDTQKMAEKLIELPDYKLANIVDIFDLRKDLISHSALDDVKGTQRFAKRLYEIYTGDA